MSATDCRDGWRTARHHGHIYTPVGRINTAFCLDRPRNRYPQAVSPAFIPLPCRCRLLDRSQGLSRKPQTGAQRTFSNRDASAAVFFNCLISCSNVTIGAPVKAANKLQKCITCIAVYKIVVSAAEGRGQEPTPAKAGDEPPGGRYEFAGTGLCQCRTSGSCNLRFAGKCRESWPRGFDCLLPFLKLPGPAPVRRHHACFQIDGQFLRFSVFHV